MIEYLKRLFSSKKQQLIPPRISVSYVDLTAQEEQLLRLMFENETLKRQIRQLDCDFIVRVGLEVRLRTSELQEENTKLRAEIARLKT